MPSNGEVMPFTCSHCKITMPPAREGREIAPGWTVVRVEQHGVSNIAIGYLYLCPNEILETKSKQIVLDLPNTNPTQISESATPKPAAPGSAAPGSAAPGSRTPPHTETT